MRDRYVELALPYIPHLVQLVDKNQYSPTYGCFDREYWHYRTLDFPCGMSQEFALPFALLYKNKFSNNPYYNLERMREIAVAGIRFAMKSSHSDGTCDDYFPFERAMGAFVFSLYGKVKKILSQYLGGILAVTKSRFVILRSLLKIIFLLLGKILVLVSRHRSCASLYCFLFLNP